MYDIDAIGEQYPTTYDESMNTVLVQECIRYNGLLTVMQKSLKETMKALKGLVVMSPELEAVASSAFDNQVSLSRINLYICSQVHCIAHIGLQLLNSRIHDNGSFHEDIAVG